VLWHPQTPYHAAIVKEIRTAAAPSLSIEPLFIQARSVADFDRAFSAIARERAQALCVLEGPVAWAHRTRLLDLVSKARLPAIYAQREYPEHGGLMSYGTSMAEMWQRSAAYVDKILRGARPGDLPIEQPTRFELVINLKTAKALGLKIPQSVLMRADQVIR
jgi:putative ABC transport system substrate-binding protein